MKMTEELFDSIINTSQDCVFWKDKKRRFLGVNQAFLDYYGFDSALIARVRKRDEIFGYIVCAARRSFRIWQENECAVIYYLAGILAETDGIRG